VLEKLEDPIPLRLDEDEGTPKFADNAKKVATQKKVVATVQGPEDDDFTTQKSRKDKKAQKRNDSDSDEELDTKPPLYLGISLHEDSKLMVKLRDMIPSNLKRLLEQFDG
jgi:hypothetical protein